MDDGAGTEQGNIYRYASASFSPVKTAPFGTYTGKFFGAPGI